MEEGGFRSHHSITESILGFTALLRAQEFNVGIREVQEAILVGRELVAGVQDPILRRLARS